MMALITSAVLKVPVVRVARSVALPPALADLGQRAIELRPACPLRRAARRCGREVVRAIVFGDSPYLLHGLWAVSAAQGRHRAG